MNEQTDRLEEFVERLLADEPLPDLEGLPEDVVCGALLLKNEVDAGPLRAPFVAELRQRLATQAQGRDGERHESGSMVDLPQSRLGEQRTAVPRHYWEANQQRSVVSQDWKGNGALAGQRLAPAPRALERQSAVRPVWRAVALAGRLVAAALLLALLAGLVVATWTLGRPLIEGRVGPLEPGATPFPAPAQAKLGKLAFVRDGDIWVKDLPEGQERRLTDDGMNAGPKWSPSGEWIAFSKAGQQWLMRADGSSTRMAGPGQVYAWSPVADVLACGASGTGIWLVDPSAATAPRPVAADGAQFAWSPDGEWLAYTAVEAISPPLSQANVPPRRATLWRVRVDGGQPELLVDNGSPSQHGLVAPGWLPDGKTITYRVQSYFSGSFLAGGTPLEGVQPGSVSARTVLPSLLTHNDYLDSSTTAGAQVGVVGNNRETWTNKRIAVLDSVTLEVIELTDSTTASISPTWSPDGQRIAYVSGPDIGQVGGGPPALEGMAKRRVMVMNRDGSEKRQLTNDPAYRDERPRWSADGSTILFGRLKDDKLQLWLMNADGSEPRQVVERIGSPPDLSREAETWFGYYGHIDWDKEYDWWQARATAEPARRPTPTPTAIAAALDVPTAVRDLDALAAQVDFSLYLPTYAPAGVGWSHGYIESRPSEGKVAVLAYEASPNALAWGPTPAVGFFLYQSKPPVPLVVTVPADQIIARPSIGDEVGVLYSNPFPPGSYGATTGLERVVLSWTGKDGMHFEIWSVLSQEETLAVARSLQQRTQKSAPTQITYRQPAHEGRMLTMEEAKERVAVFLGEAPGELNGTYRDTPGQWPPGDFRPAFHLSREVPGSRRPDNFTVDAATGEVTVAHLASNWHPPAPKEPITEAEAQVVAEAFARSRFAGLEALSFAGGTVHTVPPPPGSTDEPYRSYDAVWHLKAPGSGAILPTAVTVQIDLDTSRVAVYWSSRLDYNGPTVPMVSREEAERIALAESSKVPQLAGATVLRTQLGTTMAFEGRRLAWNVFLAVPGSEDSPSFLVDGLTGEVMNPVGTPSG